MDKIDKNSELFRSKPVHSQKLGAKRGFFRSIPVRFFSDHERDDAFPEHILSFRKVVLEVGGSKKLPLWIVGMAK